MSGESGRVEGAALGEVLQRVMHLFALFRFARHLPVSGLDAFFLHSQGSVNIMKLVVQPTGIADRVPISVPPPEGGGGGLTVRAGCPCSPCCRQPSLGLDKGPVLPIHFMVESAGIAKVVPGTISPPQWGRGCPAVHTLPACAGSCLGPRLTSEPGRGSSQQAAGWEESRAVLGHIGRIGGNGVVG